MTVPTGKHALLDGATPRIMWPHDPGFSILTCCRLSVVPAVGDVSLQCLGKGINLKQNTCQKCKFGPKRFFG